MAMSGNTVSALLRIEPYNLVERRKSILHHWHLRHVKFARKNHIVPIMVAPMAGDTIRASLKV